ncbi:MAG: peptide ABC transporter ATP-binding protein [Desulfuromonas sp.]|nr:MAG: peptide ABC transporter ATP-binding protein [Desulfuromonas sp.]
MPALLKVTDLHHSFAIPRGPGTPSGGRVHAVNGVNFELLEGETLGLVGESGCGKSTTGKLLLRLLEPEQGRIDFQGQDISHLSERQLRPLRRHMQMIFQDPFSSLNPRMRIGDILAEPLTIHGLVKPQELEAKCCELLETVGLDGDYLHRFPHEFSGGQRQRVGIARALAVRPQLIIADEPISALDISIQAQIINLLQDIQQRFKLTYLFIAHDLSVIEHISTRVAVMYLGQIVEIAPTEHLYGRYQHPYTEALLAAIPHPDPKVTRHPPLLHGEPPSQIDIPSGCTFHPRCRYASELCRTTAPRLSERGPDHLAACHHSDRLRTTPST